MYYNCPQVSNPLRPQVRYLKVKEKEIECTHIIHLMPADNNFTVLSQDSKTVLPSCTEHMVSDSLNRIETNDVKSYIETDTSHDEEVKVPSPQKTLSSQKVRRSVLSREEKDSGQTNQLKAESSQEQIPTRTKAPTEQKEIQSLTEKPSTITTKGEITSEKSSKNNQADIPYQSNDHQAIVDKDGMYLLVVFVESADDKLFNITVDIEMKSQYGYLSAVDWPLLPFYGVMCGIYVIYAIAWLVVTALQWRDLLRIQFWIGGVIFLGLVEKAVLYAEFQSLNQSGETAKSAIIFAEILSSLKRTLARMLVIIVSLGFGIVKPRLGPLLHRVVGVGALYFILSAIEGCLRSLKMKNDPSNQTLIAGVPLAVMDSAICWWIFSSLVQTTRTLQLRRNLVKLTLYKHFTNTLIFAVLASIAYMIWSIHSHKFANCITDWKELWVDDAYWHLLFSIILLVIMVLWRPTNNNQRYAFTPLLDAEDDYDEDETKDHALNNDAFGTKMRGGKNQNNTPVQKHKEDDIKWVEENIPSLSEPALPSLLDSDEEIMTAKFERNKME
uniref:Transmembrane protein 87A n=1 Tax=Hadrurus spadix TaxID=141984 RepID=A0A1W7R9E5_9SCOR